MIDGLGAAASGLSAQSRRMDALASDAANANTPGYARRDVDFHSALRQAMTEGPQALRSVQFSPQVDSSAVMQADGNGIDIDVESANLAQNGLEYQSLVQVARGRIDILIAAMGAV